MRITIGTELLPPDPQWAWDPAKPLSGTTKFYVRVAEEFVKIGHDVFVEYAGPLRTLNGVRYGQDSGDLFLPDLFLDCNRQRPAPEEEADDLSPARVQWTSFFNRPDTCVGEGYDRLFLVSDYVKSTLAPHLKAPATVLELGTDASLLPEPNLAARGKVCCYTSSPDRGGKFLDAIWPDVEEATGYRLEKSPYGQDFSDEDMRALYERSRFWVYPCIGTDSIVSCLEAQAAGCIPFYVPHMGLPETCRYGVTTDLFRFKADLIRTLNEAEARPQWFGIMDDQREDGFMFNPIPTWADVAKKILSFV